MTTINLMPGAQSAFVESAAMYPAYIAGRRGGKTVASVSKMVMYIQRYPDCVGCVTFPSLDDRERIFVPTLEQFFGSGKGVWWDYAKKDGLFTAGGAKVFLRTAEEPDRLRGMTLSFAAMDEVGTGDQHKAWEILRPSLTREGHPHQFWVTTTPNVDAGWLRTVWRDKVHPETKEPLEPGDYPVFTARTVDNYFLPDSVRKLVLEAGGTRRALQEYEGQWLESKGVRFADLLDPMIHLRQPKVDEQWRNTGIAGLDPGSVSPTALVEWKQDLSGRLWAVDEFYKPNADEYEWVEWCRDKRIKKVIVDPTGSSKEQIKHWRKRWGLNIEAAPMGREGVFKFKQKYNWWATGLEPRCLRHTERCHCPDRVPGIFISPNCTNLWSELMNLEAHIPRGMEEPEDRWRPGSQDHAFDAGVYGGSWFGSKVHGRPISPIQIVRAA